eukprot:280829-Chlamydomonas_euryale.AAC.11
MFEDHLTRDMLMGRYADQSLVFVSHGLTMRVMVRSHAATAAVVIKGRGVCACVCVCVEYMLMRRYKTMARWLCESRCVVQCHSIPAQISITFEMAPRRAEDDCLRLRGSTAHTPYFHTHHPCSP